MNRDMVAVALNHDEWGCVRALLAKEILEPRCGQDPGLLNDIAHMFSFALPVDLVEALRDS